MRTVLPTAFFAVPRVWEKLEAVLRAQFVANPSLTPAQAAAAIGLDKCTTYSYGAAALKQSTVDFFNTLKMPLFNLYGMSENTGPFVVQSHDKYHLAKSGWPMPSN